MRYIGISAIYVAAFTAAETAQQHTSAISQTANAWNLQRDLQSNDSTFDDICNYYKETRFDFDCACDVRGRSIACVSELECDQRTMTCATFSTVIAFAAEEWNVKRTEVCVDYSDLNSEEDSFLMNDGCILIEAESGLLRPESCFMFFNADPFEQSVCTSCTLCEDKGGGISFDIDCSNVEPLASTNGCQYMDTERRFFPGFNDITVSTSGCKTLFTFLSIGLPLVGLLGSM